MLTPTAFRRLYDLTYSEKSWEKPQTEWSELIKSLSEAISTLTAMVLDSPVEARYGRMLAELFTPFNTSKPRKKDYSKADQSMFWYPRKPIQHYQTLCRHPKVKGWDYTLIPFFTLIFQQDNMAKLTGIPRGTIYKYSAVRFIVLFDEIGKLLKVLRPKTLQKQTGTSWCPGSDSSVSLQTGMYRLICCSRVGIWKFTIE